MKFLRDSAERVIRKYLPLIMSLPGNREYFPYHVQERFVRFGVGFTTFVMTVASFVVIIWFFNRMLGLLGFERTVVTMLAIIGFLLRSALEKS